MELIKELEELKNENESLKLKNELLSSTLASFIGSNHVEQINKDKQKDKKPKSK
jgi:regulator of replication initiation timing